MYVIFAVMVMYVTFFPHRRPYAHTILIIIRALHVSNGFTSASCAMVQFGYQELAPGPTSFHKSFHFRANPDD